MAANGYVQYRIRRSGTVKPVWLFGLSALDLAAISFSVSLSGGFNSPYLALYYLALYYFAVAVFAYVFTAPRLVLPWTHPGGRPVLGNERYGEAGAGPLRQGGEQPVL